MKIHHVAMFVSDLERTKEFFIKYFDATCGDMYHNKTTGLRTYMLMFSDGAKLEIMNRPDVHSVDKAGFGLGYSHISFSVGSKEKVDELTGLMQSDGYKVISGPRVTGDGFYESCVLDHECNHIEITV